MTGFARKHRILGWHAAIIAFPLCTMNAAGSGLDRPPEEGEVDYSPADHAVSSVNPPPFVWLPLEGVESYRLQVSRSANFAPAETVNFDEIPLTVHAPEEELEPGKWYWRYGFQDNGETRFGRPRPFRIDEEAVSLPFPPIDQVMTKVPDTRPRIYYSPERVREIRSDPDGRYQEIVQPVVRAAERVLERDEPLFEEPAP